MLDNYLDKIETLVEEASEIIDKADNYSAEHRGTEEHLRRNEDEDNPGEITRFGESALALDETANKVRFTITKLSELGSDIEEGHATNQEEIEELLSDFDEQLVNHQGEVESEKPVEESND